MEWRRSEGGCWAINNGTGGGVVMLSYSLHKTYHQRIALYCAAYLCLCSLSFVHTLATRTKTVKELLQLNWSIIDHYYLHCYTGWSMAPVLADDDIFILLQDILATKQISR